MASTKKNYNKDKNTGKKGGRATIVATAAFGGIAGMTLGGIAGAMMVNRGVRSKVADTLDHAADYANSAVDAFEENKDQIRNAADKVSSTSQEIKKK